MDATTAQQWSASSQGDRQARSNGRLFTAVAALADPAARPAAAHELATLVGAEELIVILPDHEVGVPLPAPALPSAGFSPCFMPGVTTYQTSPTSWP